MIRLARGGKCGFLRQQQINFAARRRRVSTGQRFGTAFKQSRLRRQPGKSHVANPVVKVLSIWRRV